MSTDKPTPESAEMARVRRQHAARATSPRYPIAVHLREKDAQSIVVGEPSIHACHCVADALAVAMLPAPAAPPPAPVPGGTGDEATDTEPLRMNAYYYGFDETGQRVIDRVLSAVACAGKAFHHTESWTDDSERDEFPGKNPVEWIQGAANDAAAVVSRLAADNARLTSEAKMRDAAVAHMRKMVGCGEREGLSEGIGRLAADNTALTARVAEAEAHTCYLFALGGELAEQHSHAAESPCPRAREFEGVRALLEAARTPSEPLAARVAELEAAARGREDK